MATAARVTDQVQPAAAATAATRAPAAQPASAPATQWHESYEIILKEMADEAQISAFVHSRSHEYFSNRSNRYELPITLFSVLAGFGNFLSSHFEDQQQAIIVSVGILSVFTAVLSQQARKLKLNELSEAHRISSISWGKFYNGIRIQLMRRRSDRMAISEYIRNITDEYQRLLETSPLAPKVIRGRIKRKRKRLRQTGMSIPFWLNNMHPTEVWELDGNDNHHHRPMRGVTITGTGSGDSADASAEAADVVVEVMDEESSSTADISLSSNSSLFGSRRTTMV